MDIRRPGRWAVALGTVAVLLGVEMSIGAVPAHAAVPGYEIVTATSATDSTIYKSVTARCTGPGKRVIGTGFRITGAQGDVVLDDLIPGTTSVTVGAGEDQDGTNQWWSVTAVAVCADPLPGLEVVTVSSPFQRTGYTTVTANCPAGKSVVGTGASLTNGWGQVAIRRLEQPPSTAGVVAVGSTDQDGYDGKWLITAYAVCAEKPPGLVSVSQDSGTSSASPKLVAADCPDGSRALAIGWGTNDNDQVLVVHADIRQSSVIMVATADDDGYDDVWRLRTTVTCAFR